MCLTPENIDKPWIIFEAGALSKKFEKSRVCTILFDLRAADIDGPLAQFQHTLFNRGDFKKLVEMLNSIEASGRIDSKVLERAFDKWWPDLESQIDSILAEMPSEAKPQERKDREILEEVLDLVRRVSFADKSIRRIHPPINKQAVIDTVIKFNIAFDSVVGDGSFDISAIKAMQELVVPLRHIVLRTLNEEERHRWLALLKSIEDFETPI